MARKAARVTDDHACPLTAPSAHVGGPILPAGAPHTLINGKNAARVADKATCVAPAPDTVRGGLLTVFVDGSPASRIDDKTDVGTITVGSPDVVLGESKGGPLTPFQAQWLYGYMADQKHIPFEYATDGCFARADRMAENIRSLGIDVQKQWVSGTPAAGPLHVPIPGYPSGGVTWGWHVAPIVEVTQWTGGTEWLIIDPSLRPGGPISVEDWIARQSINPGATARAVTSPDVYFHGYDWEKGVWDDTSDFATDPARTAEDLNDYRVKRAALPADSGRNVPNEPVHY